MKERALDGELLPLVAPPERDPAGEPGPPAVRQPDFRSRPRTTQLLAYVKRTRQEHGARRSSTSIPRTPQEGVAIVPAALGLPPAFRVRDLLDDDALHLARRAGNYVRLEPGERQAHVLRVERRGEVTRIGVEREVELRLERDHPNPHHVLGAHPADGGVVVRTYRPDATAVRAVPEGGAAVELALAHPGGVFEGLVPGAELPLAYRLEVDYPDGSSFSLDDPYRFLPALGELDLHLAGEGRHEELYEELGAHVRELDSVRASASPCGRQRHGR